jgi:hypothetical protein
VHLYAFLWTSCHSFHHCPHILSSTAAATHICLTNLRLSDPFWKRYSFECNKIYTTDLRLNVVRLLCRPVMSKSIQDTVTLPQNVVLTYRNTSKLSSHCVCWLSTNALDKSCSLTLCFKWYKYFLIKFLIWMCWSYSRKPFLSMWEWIFFYFKIY